MLAIITPPALISGAFVAGQGQFQVLADLSGGLDDRWYCHGFDALGVYSSTAATVWMDRRTHEGVRFGVAPRF